MRAARPSAIWSSSRRLKTEACARPGRDDGPVRVARPGGAAFLAPRASRRPARGAGGRPDRGWLRGRSRASRKAGGDADSEGAFARHRGPGRAGRGRSGRSSAKYRGFGAEPDGVPESPPVDRGGSGRGDRALRPLLPDGGRIGAWRVQRHARTWRVLCPCRRPGAGYRRRSGHSGGARMKGVSVSNRMSPAAMLPT